MKKRMKTNLVVGGFGVSERPALQVELFIASLVGCSDAAAERAAIDADAALLQRLNGEALLVEALLVALRLSRRRWLATLRADMSARATAWEGLGRAEASVQTPRPTAARRKAGGQASQTSFQSKRAD